ncbi:MAG: hypothetical protein ACOZF0_06650 [Thermodesulfobacteriota bacterium]
MELHSLERRQHRRIPVRAGLYAAVKKPRFLNLAKPQLVKLGPLIDISMGGLAIHYIENNHRALDHSTLDLVTARGEIALEDFSVRMIFDRKVAELPGKKWIRKRALAFEGLPGSHWTRIEELLARIPFSPDDSPVL